MLPIPEIRDGTAKLSGTIENFHSTTREDNQTLDLFVPYPVTAESYHAITTVNEDGSFSFEVPMQCNYAIGSIVSEHTSHVFYVSLTSGKETKVDILYERRTGTWYKIINQTDSLGLTTTDQTNITKVENELYSYLFSPQIFTGYAKTPDEFVKRAKISQNQLLKKLKENDVLSEIAKNSVANEMRLLVLNLNLLEYRARMKIDYANAGKDIVNFNPPEPGKKYYAFLKDFDLNNPQHLYDGRYYSDVLQKILLSDTLNISPIGDIPIDQWMEATKSNLSKLVGFNKGLFYDMLAANSYARQFNNELRPLSDKQKENIQNYFKDNKKEFAKILLKRNEEIIRLAALKDPLVMNMTPAVSREQLKNAIISKYRGKVVVVDFWATWCAPCLAAMEQYRDVKGELKGKDVVFVYLTNHSSPQKLWEERIRGIGGEHYYLNDDEWEYIMDTFDFEVIPTYLIFDAKGKLAQKFISYPGNDRMQAAIEKLLP
jgi:thiol-disulfide isomerase/thioredoxin